jgi:diguanylate cyclase (GGDEF)-like protein
VLVVEDDPAVAELLARLLGGEHRVSVAGNGALGLALAQARPPPDLILLDVMMAGLDGYEVCRALKSMPETREIPVIFVTGRVDAEGERRGLELGAVDYIHKPFERRAVQARVRNHLAVKRQGDELLRLSEEDALTGLPNRRRLDAFLAETWGRLAGGGEPLGLLMMDVDHFKAYNDRYGHAAGDECLRRIAAALKAVCPGGGALVGRYGGEELLCAIPGADVAAARAAAQRVLGAVRGLAIPHAASPSGPVVTLSIGVAAARPALGGSVEECIALADRQLYLAKSQGRDRMA